MVLILIALFGLFVPNGLFFYYMFVEFNNWSEIFSNLLALSFIIDAFIATALIAWYFAMRPIGTVRWPWFIILSLLGGLGFSLPFYWWLNQTKKPKVLN